MFGPQPDNVIVIVVDALRADHLGCYGYARPTSPNLDALAARSVVFEQAYSHSPWTMPAVATLFTSLHPRDHGIQSWRNPLDERFYTLAEHFRTQGYYTAGHASHVIFREKYGFDQGFDTFSIKATDNKRIKYESTSAEVTDLALAELAALPPKQDFFLWLHYFDPHHEYLAHEKYPFGDKHIDRYDSEIAFTDEHLGRLFDALTAQERWQDTVVVITADHGEEFGDHGGILHTRTLYEEVLHIPLIVYVPGYQPARIDTPVRTIDVAPTLVDLVDLPLPDSFRGKPWPLDRNGFGDITQRPLHAETNEQARLRALRRGGWKLIRDLANKTTELYNLAADPHEQRNLTAQHPRIARKMRQRIRSFYAGKRRVSRDQTLSPEMENDLKNLGYLQ